MRERLAAGALASGRRFSCAVARCRTAHGLVGILAKLIQDDGRAAALRRRAVTDPRVVIMGDLGQNLKWRRTVMCCASQTRRSE